MVDLGRTAFMIYIPNDVRIYIEEKNILQQ